MDLAQLFARFRASSASFSGRQIALLIAAFLVIVGTVIGGSYVSAPAYRLLFSDMDPAAASDVVEKLKAQKIPYEIVDGGRGIRVPETRVDELRLAFTAQGLPSTGRIGFEIFDRTAFGETEFLEHVNYRRALEGEIARTISTIGEVSSARVHIAMAKESLFESREQPAKASVILKLKGRQPLPAATVSGITSLVASSVEGLRADSVVILDNFGRPLTRPADETSPTGFSLERQQRVEHDLSTRVVSLLEPIVGSGRVRVNVAARLNSEAAEETEEQYNPTTVLRSRQTNSDSQQVGSASAIAGARANLAPPPTAAAPPTTATTGAASASASGTTPPAPPAPSSGTTTASSRSTETANYEISKLIRHSTKPSGDVARLWVAVLVDDDVQMQAGENGGTPTSSRKPRTPAELQKIQGLVSAAVGLDQDRGDQLTVENVAFDTPAAESMTAPAPTAPVANLPRTIWLAAGAAAIVLALVLIGVVTRAVLKRAPAPPVQTAAAPKVELPAAVAGGFPRTVQDLQTDIEAQLNAEVERATGAQKLPALARRVGNLASKEPEAVALLVRSWMAEDRR